MLPPLPGQAAVPTAEEILPTSDTMLNWGNGEIDWTSGGVGAPAQPSERIGQMSGVDAIVNYDGGSDL